MFSYTILINADVLLMSEVHLMFKHLYNTVSDLLRGFHTFDSYMLCL